MSIKNEFKSYRKKSIVIEAIQVKDFIKKAEKSSIEIKPIKLNDRKVWIFKKQIMIETEEGQMKAGLNDYLIVGIVGEIYPCREDIFNTTYDKIENLEIKI